MATIIKQCKYCGKDYEYCHSNRPKWIYRWQDVACCPEHGSLYLEMVERQKNEKIAETIVTEEPYDDADDLYEDFDDELEEDFGEDDDE